VNSSVTRDPAATVINGLSKIGCDPTDAMVSVISGLTGVGGLGMGVGV